MTWTPRLTRSELARLTSSLGERDLSIVRSLAKLRLATTKQIERIHFVNGTPQSNARMAREVLRRLTSDGVLIRLDRRIGGVRAGSSGHVYSLSVVGQHVAGLASGNGRRRRPFEPGLLYVQHRLAVTELFASLTEAARSGALELIEFEAEPDCWRPFFGLGGARTLLKPDAFVRTARKKFEELWFVEVDRGTHSSASLKRKFRTYRQYWSSNREQGRWGGVFPRVLWLTPSVPRLRTLIDVAAAQPAEAWELFTVRLFDEALRVMTPEAEK